MMAMAVVLLAVTASLAGKVLFEDKFTSLDPSWGAPGPVMDVKDGKLIITPGTNTSQTILNQANVLPNDMEASFAMTFVKSPAPTWGSGLVFWGKDYNEYYAVLVNAEGWFAVQRYVSGRYLLPVAWRESDVIKKGEGAENQIKVATKANKPPSLLMARMSSACPASRPRVAASSGLKWLRDRKGQIPWPSAIFRWSNLRIGCRCRA